jgi:hypothetical protein
MWMGIFCLDTEAINFRIFSLIIQINKKIKFDSDFTHLVFITSNISGPNRDAADRSAESQFIVQSVYCLVFS